MMMPPAVAAPEAEVEAKRNWRGDVNRGWLDIDRRGLIVGIGRFGINRRRTIYGATAKQGGRCANCDQGSYDGFHDRFLSRRDYMSRPEGAGAFTFFYQVLRSVLQRLSLPALFAEQIAFTAPTGTLPALAKGSPPGSALPQGRQTAIYAVWRPGRC